jgi:hypothetical protein
MTKGEHGRWRLPVLSRYVSFTLKKAKKSCSKGQENIFLG